MNVPSASIPHRLPSLQRLTLRLAWAMLVSVLCFSGASCKKKGPTVKEVVETHRADVEARKKELKKIAKIVPEDATEEISVKKKLSPELSYSKAFRGAWLLPYEALKDPTKQPKLEPDLLYDHEPINVISWVEDPPPGDGDSIESQFGYGKQKQPYLIVYRIVSYEPVVATEEDSFTGGELTVDGFVIDTDKVKVVAAVRAVGHPDKEGSFKYKEGDDKKQALEQVASAALRRNTMHLLAKKLSAATKSKILFDEYGPSKEATDEPKDEPKGDDDEEEDE